MKTSIAIVTAIFDGYETLKPTLPQYGHNVDWVCVTDNPALALPLESTGPAWRVVVVETEEPGIVAAKGPKFQPWRWTSADQSIWLDASFRVASPYAACGMIDRAHPIAQFAHPDRDCIYDEAIVSAALDRYAGLPIFEQAENYFTNHRHPKHWGLWAAGAIARRHENKVMDFGASWAAECQRWGHQDQISEAPTLARHGMRPVTLPGSIYDNQWLKYEPSERHREEQK